MNREVLGLDIGERSATRFRGDEQATKLAGQRILTSARLACSWRPWIMAIVAGWMMLPGNGWVSTGCGQSASRTEPTAASQELSPASLGSSANQSDEATEATIPPPLAEYQGRRIAEPMSYHGAPWLFRSEREDEERCSLLLANLGLRRGMTVCDLGCGNGYHSMPLARLVGEEGQILAVDIQPEMLQMLRENAERGGVENITPILGSVHDPRLPAESVDLIFLVDVYHEFSHPVQMLARMREALKPDGRIALVEFRAEDESVPIKPEHKMSKAQIMKEFPPNGFKLIAEFDKLPWQHVLFFGKDESYAPE
jgi:2-polyprenyl-3-methyl-5-hydroxy-6-metoxy-1,4-benzoquinol methylase